MKKIRYLTTPQAQRQARKIARRQPDMVDELAKEKNYYPPGGWLSCTIENLVSKALRLNHTREQIDRCLNHFWNEAHINHDDLAILREKEINGELD